MAKRRVSNGNKDLSNMLFKTFRGAAISQRLMETWFGLSKIKVNTAAAEESSIERKSPIYGEIALHLSLIS